MHLTGYIMRRYAVTVYPSTGGYGESHDRQAGRRRSGVERHLLGCLGDGGPQLPARRASCSAYGARSGMPLEAVHDNATALGAIAVSQLLKRASCSSVLALAHRGAKNES